MKNIFQGLIALVLILSVSNGVSSNYYNKQSKGYDNKTFSFALIGDAPYDEINEPKFDNLIDDINSDDSVKFVIHVGDFKGGGERCDDELLVRRFDQFQQFKRPFIFTPGDNDWTDCHRTNNGSYLPTERLDFLRSLYYPNPNYTTGGRPIRVKTQANVAGYEQFVENTLFTKKRVVFSQIHVVGSSNNLRPWDQLDPNDTTENPRADRIKEYEDRNVASLAWLDKTFKLAKSKKSPAIFISIHADPQLSEAAEDRLGFNDFLESLFEHTRDFAKPVVLAHGDSHFFRVDTPRLLPWYYNPDRTSNDETGNDVVTDLVRVETFGDSNNHWVKVNVDPSSKEVFTFSPIIVDANRR